MEGETHSETEVVEKNTPVIQPQASVAAKPVWKELLIPASIVVAGLCVGLGMYFSGGSTSAGDVAAVDLTGGIAQPNVQADPAILIPQLVLDAGVGRDEFVECFDSQRTASKVQDDADNAVETGGRGTPWSVVIGPNGTTYPLNGAVPAATVEQVIELARSGAASQGGDTDSVNPVDADDYIKGSADAPIVIVEYSDYDCPFCSRFHTTMDSVVAKHNDVAWVYRHFPLDQLHPQARTVALAAECVGELGGNEAFWSFTDGYFASK